MIQGKSFVEKAEAHRQEINSIAIAILKQMKDGAGKYEMPWHKGIPASRNAFTGKQYGGNNLIILWDKCLKNSYTENLWATLYQWRKVKAKVRKGEKGTLICVAVPKKQSAVKQKQQLKLFEPIKVDEINSSNNYFRFSFYHVFNVAQVNGYSGNQPGLFDNPLKGEPLLNQLITKSNAKIIHGGEKAFYSMIPDEIHMPDKARFVNSSGKMNSEFYYSVIVHEMVHWSGHPTRCNRTLLSKFGTPAYAFEELVAELGAALLCTQLNQKIVPSIIHAQYLKSWFHVLQYDFSYFTEALELARTSINYLNALTDIYPFLKPQNKREVKEERIEEWIKLVNEE